MEAKRRNIKSGVGYDHLFPSSENDNKTIRRYANVYHTVEFIPKVVAETLDQTKNIARLLKGRSLDETCSNIWHFVYGHINYKKDQEGYEQIRSPARTWHDRRRGVDCDCYSVFISSILTNLDIPHILRITKYHRDYFQHIYPVVKSNGKEIIVDCVTDKFNYEVPYSEKKDYPMDLQYLNGFDSDGTEELGKVIAKSMAKKKPIPVKAKKIPIAVKKAAPALVKKIKTKAASKSLPVRQAGSPTTPTSKPATSLPVRQAGVPPVKKKKGIIKKVVSKINKINPATILLRNGILASMKLNMKNVAKRLRWSYLTPDQAKAKGIDPVKFQKLISVRQKLENIFTVAGGKADNLRKAILGGKGNKDKAVNGLGMLPMDNVGLMSEYMPMKTLLGTEIYYSENIEGMDGLGQLGEPLTLTSIAAAAGVVAGIVAALKQVGDIFLSKKKESADFDESKTDAPENNVTTSANNTTPSNQNSESIINPVSQNSNKTSALVTDEASSNDSSQNFDSGSSQQYTQSNNNSIVRTTNYSNSANENDETVDDNVEEKSSTAVTISNTTSTDNTGTDTNKEKEGFWDKNKTWIKPVAIGVGGLTLIAIGVKMFKGSKVQNKSSPSRHELSGLSHKKKKKKNHHRKHKHHHKHAVALL